MRAAGAVFVGKCNLHEFALGTTGEESAFGPTRNPHAPDHVPGGSSSGSAASVAAGMAVASIGTDTGGSIRIPAAACGLVGLKPTHGELSLQGIVPLAPSLDHVGPITRSVRDAAIVYQVLAGGRGDRALPAAARGARLGVPQGYFMEEMDPAVRGVFESCITRLEAAGCRVEEIDIPHAAETPDVYRRTQLPEAAAYHRETLEVRPDDYGEQVRLRLEMGRRMTAEEYARAQRERRLLSAEVDAALDGRAALLLPTLPIVPPRLGADAETARRRMLRLTQLFDVTGHPAISVPCEAAGGLPAGVQLIGRRGKTANLLVQAAALEPVVRG
ncbi:MAG: amidase [Acidobacteria bacterium]|nr:amidase [Acidobacteriota bacterium]